MISNQPVVERDLVQLAQQGDQEAFGELVKKYQDRLNKAMIQVAGCPAEAEDAVQEAFLQAFLSLHRFRGQSTFYTWLYRIAYNRTVDARRKSHSHRLRQLPLRMDVDRPSRGDSSPARPLERAEEKVRVEEALSQLPEAYRRVLVLREIEGLDYAAIADSLDLSIGTVRSRLHRARHQIRREVRRLAVAANET